MKWINYLNKKPHHFHEAVKYVYIIMLIHSTPQLHQQFRGFRW